MAKDPYSDFSDPVAPVATPDPYAAFSDRAGTPAPTVQPEGSWDAPAPTLGQSAARQGKLAVRALASAAASPVTLVGDTLNKFVNGAGELLGFKPGLQMPSHVLQRSLSAAGLPEPTTGIEKFTQGLAETAPSFALPGTLGAQMSGNAAIGATQAAPGNEGWGAAIGAGAGAVGQGIARLIGGPVRPTEAARQLLDKGVALTPGQAAGKGSIAKTVEEYASTLPIASHFVRSAQRRAVEESNVAAAQTVADMVDKSVKLGKPPREAIEATRETIGTAYDQGLSGMAAPGYVVESNLGTRLADLPQMFPMVPSTEFQTMVRYINQRIGDASKNAGGMFTGPQLKQLDTEIGQHVRNLYASTDAAQKASAPAWRQLQQSLREVMEMAQSDPAKRQQLESANAAYRQLLTLERSLLPGAETFTPRRLAAQLDKVGIKEGPLRVMSNAMTETLPNIVPSSGTAERALMASLPAIVAGGGVGADHLGYPTLGAGMMAAGALGSRTGSRLMTGATKPQKMLSPYEQQIAAFVANALREKRDAEPK